MEIHFCGQCGQRISPEEFEQNRVRKVDESTYHCVKCAAPAGSASQRSSRTRVTPPGGRHREAKVSGSSGTAVSGRHAQQSLPGTGRPLPVLAIVGGGVVLLAVVALVVLIAASSKTEPDANERTSGRALSTGDGPSAGKSGTPATLRPPPVLPQVPSVSSNAVPGGTSPVPERKTDEASAQDAFVSLEKFEGLAPDDRAGRVKRVEEFLAQYGDTLVASRARLLLRQLSTTSDVVREFDFSKGNAQGWTASSGLEPFTFADGALITRTTKGDAFMDSGNLNVDASSVTHVIFRFRSDKPGGTQVYYSTSKGSAYQLNEIPSVHCAGDGQWHDYEVKLAGRKNFAGQLRRFRLDPVNGDACVGANVGFQWIRLVKRGG